MKVEVKHHEHWARVELVSSEEGGDFLNPSTIVSLRSTLVTLAANPSVRCLLLRAGDCLGAQIDQIAVAEREALKHHAASFCALLQELHDLRPPVLFWATGRTLGGAVALAAACDFVLCGEKARFNLPEAGLGLAPILIQPWVTRRIGPARFRSWALSGLEMDAEAACLTGLADGLFAGPGFPSAYARLLRSSPAALDAIKQMSRLQVDCDPVERFIEFVSDPQVREDLGVIAAGGSVVWRRKAQKVS
jgi:enoyl-CoA hydratase/carnithine racemase